MSLEFKCNYNSPDKTIEKELLKTRVIEGLDAYLESFKELSTNSYTNYGDKVVANAIDLNDLESAINKTKNLINGQKVTAVSKGGPQNLTNSCQSIVDFPAVCGAQLVTRIGMPAKELYDSLVSLINKIDPSSNLEKLPKTTEEILNLNTDDKQRLLNNKLSLIDSLLEESTENQINICKEFSNSDKDIEKAANKANIKKISENDKQNVLILNDIRWCFRAYEEALRKLNFKKNKSSDWNTHNYSNDETLKNILHIIKSSCEFSISFNNFFKKCTLFNDIFSLEISQSDINNYNEINQWITNNSGICTVEDINERISKIKITNIKLKNELTKQLSNLLEEKIKISTEQKQKIEQFIEKNKKISTDLKYLREVFDNIEKYTAEIEHIPNQKVKTELIENLLSLKKFHKNNYEHITNLKDKINNSFNKFDKRIESANKLLESTDGYDKTYDNFKNYVNRLDILYTQMQETISDFKTKFAKFDDDGYYTEELQKYKKLKDEKKDQLQMIEQNKINDSFNKFYKYIKSDNTKIKSDYVSNLKKLYEEINNDIANFCKDYGGTKEIDDLCDEYIEKLQECKKLKDEKLQDLKQQRRKKFLESIDKSKEKANDIQLTAYDEQMNDFEQIALKISSLVKSTKATPANEKKFDNISGLLDTLRNSLDALYKKGEKNADDKTEIKRLKMFIRAIQGHIKQKTGEQPDKKEEQAMQKYKMLLTNIKQDLNEEGEKNNFQSVTAKSVKSELITETNETKKLGSKLKQKLGFFRQNRTK